MPTSTSRPTIASSTRIHSSNDERDVDRGDELVAVAGLRHAHRRPQVRRLHEARVAQLVLDAQHERVDVLTLAEREPARHGQVRRGERALHHHLVHRDGRPDDARADVRHARELEQPLHGAVLAVRAVQQRDDHVEPGRGDPALTERHQLVRTRLGQLRDVRALHRERLRERVAAGREQLAGLFGEEPATFLGDRDGHDVVALGVERVAHRDRADARDVVLRGPTAEQQQDADLLRHVRPAARRGCRAP